MTTIEMIRDEDYPVYFITENSCGTSVEVEPATLKRWNRVRNEYTQVQEEMSRAYDQACEQEKRSREIANAEKDFQDAARRLNQLKGES